MSEDWQEILRDIQKSTAKLKAANPEILTAFQAVRHANHSITAIDAKTRELIAIGISVAMHCDGCIASHVSQAKKAGATLEEIGAALSTAMMIGIGNQFVQSLSALDAYDQF